jgi:predicted HTH domain antitoxin
MYAMEREHTSLRKAVKYWKIPLNSLSDHLNGRTKCKKVGLEGMLKK